MSPDSTNASIPAMSNDTGVKRGHYYASHEEANKSVRSVRRSCTMPQNSLAWAIQIKKKDAAEPFGLGDTN